MVVVLFVTDMKMNTLWERSTEGKVHVHIKVIAEITNINYFKVTIKVKAYSGAAGLMQTLPSDLIGSQYVFPVVGVAVYREGTPVTPRTPHTQLAFAHQLALPAPHVEVRTELGSLWNEGITDNADKRGLCEWDEEKCIKSVRHSYWKHCLLATEIPLTLN